MRPVRLSNRVRPTFRFSRSANSWASLYRSSLRPARIRGITWVDLTLHIGVGTFRPIITERLEQHVMHAEWAELSPEAVAVIESRRRRGGRIVAVGTTSARTLETAAVGDTVRPFSGKTRLYIQPGHVFLGFDALITNFHLPRSSLLVLVCAFGGLD